MVHENSLHTWSIQGRLQTHFPAKTSRNLAEIDYITFFPENGSETVRNESEAVKNIFLISSTTLLLLKTLLHALQLLSVPLASTRSRSRNCSSVKGTISIHLKSSSIVTRAVVE